MGKVVTYSVKIDSEIRDEASRYCEKRGIKVRKFVENALLHEIKLETARERAMDFDAAFDRYEERKAATAEDFIQLMDQADTQYGNRSKRNRK